MDNRRLPSPPSIRVCDFNNPSHKPSTTNSHKNHNYIRSPSSESRTYPTSSHAPMAIPNTREPLAPPPLPPPRHIEDLDVGYDAGWAWANRFAATASSGKFGEERTLPPINPTSSLFGGGGHARPQYERRSESFELEHAATSPDEDTEMLDFRPDSSPRTRHLPLGKGNPSINVSPPLAGPALHWDKSLSEKSVERASNAYDQHLLAKIGSGSSSENKSPGRRSPSLTSDGGKGFAALPIHSKSRITLPSLPSLSTDDGMLSPPEDLQSWNSGFQSTGASPGISPGGRSPYSDYVSHRSGSIDSTQGLNRYGQTGIVITQHDDEMRAPSPTSAAAAAPGPLKQGSCDQYLFLGFDLGSPVDRSRRRSERSLNGQAAFTPLDADLPHKASRHGMKRRASSPPRGVAAAADSPFLQVTTTGFNNGDGDQRRISGSSWNGSPTARYPSVHGSISSVSSASVRSGSYASSMSLSVGGSSMTSISPIDRPSPGAVSPTSEKGMILYHQPNNNLPSPGCGKSPESGSLQVPPSPLREPTDRNNLSLTTIKPNLQPAAAVAAPCISPSSTSKNTAPRVGRPHICDCCIKKPKRFDTLDELRAHESEKRYTCQFCRKRFKNKNEAERHQNSLHLRPHSWSCAALAGYEAAFYSSTSSQNQSISGPSRDTCGYCGEEFTNFPQPAWDRRIEHLTTVHKFGECNQSKRFYRADHFRQHLKHSHAGTSGKWTNTLENACMKEEIPPDADEQQPPPLQQQYHKQHHGRSGSEAGPADPIDNDMVLVGRKKPTTGPGTVLKTETIDEVMDES